MSIELYKAGGSDLKDLKLYKLLCNLTVSNNNFETIALLNYPTVLDDIKFLLNDNKNDAKFKNIVKTALTRFMFHMSMDNFEKALEIFLYLRDAKLSKAKKFVLFEYFGPIDRGIEFTNEERLT